MTPQVVTLGHGLWDVTGSCRWGPMMGFVPLGEEARELAHAFHPVEDTVTSGSLQPGSGPLRTPPAGTLVSGSWPPELSFISQLICVPLIQLQENKLDLLRKAT